ncbi:MAG: hypothetical protein RSD99_16030, partial [Janthinobacterium sp.]
MFSFFYPSLNCGAVRCRRGDIVVDTREAEPAVSTRCGDTGKVRATGLASVGRQVVLHIIRSDDAASCVEYGQVRRRAVDQR